MESEPMLTPREKSPLREQFSPEEDRTHDAASSRTESPTHYQQTIPAPIRVSSPAFPVGLFPGPVLSVTGTVGLVLQLVGPVSGY